MYGAHGGASVNSVLQVEGRWRREEALTSALKARGLWYLVSPVAPLLWAWPPPWLWLWGSTPRSCPRRHSSSSLWPDCEWRGVGKGEGREGGEDGVGVKGLGGGWVTGAGYRGAGSDGGGGGRCVRWIVDKNETEDKKRGGGARKESRGAGGKQTKIKQKMGKEYKQRGGN